MKLLFVCTGNTCRSVMAEALTSKLIKDLNLEGPWEVLSAGLGAFPGAPASAGALSVLAKEGIDLSLHQAKQLTEKMIHEADLVLTMTTPQRDYLWELLPESREKIHLLKEFARGEVAGVGETDDISDPFGQEEVIYRECADQLVEAIEQVLKGLAKKKG